jgi:hypothetical protein
MNYNSVVTTYERLADAHVTTLGEGSSNFMDGLQDSISILEQQINSNNDLCYLITLKSSRAVIVVMDIFLVTFSFSKVPRDMTKINVLLEISEKSSGVVGIGYVRFLICRMFRKDST